MPSFATVYQWVVAGSLAVLLILAAAGVLSCFVPLPGRKRQSPLGVRPNLDSAV